MTKTRKIIYFILFICSVALSILTFFFAFSNSTSQFANGSIFCGMILLCSSLINIGQHFTKYGFTSKNEIYRLIFNIVEAALGIAFICSEPELLTVLDVCLYWGIFDIAKSAAEIGHTLPEIKESKWCYVELLLLSGDLVLGVLLTLHRTSGIKIHVIFIALVLLISSFKNLFDIYSDKFFGKKEEK